MQAARGLQPQERFAKQMAGVSPTSEGGFPVHLLAAKGEQNAALNRTHGLRHRAVCRRPPVKKAGGKAALMGGYDGLVPKGTGERILRCALNDRRGRWQGHPVSGRRGKAADAQCAPLQLAREAVRPPIWHPARGRRDVGIPPYGRRVEGDGRRVTSGGDEWGEADGLPDKRPRGAGTQRNHARRPERQLTISASTLFRSSFNIFETPSSCMVTPYSTSAASMVPRRWVITINWVLSVIRRRYWA